MIDYNIKYAETINFACNDSDRIKIYEGGVKMYIEKIDLINYKAFEDLEIELQPGVNLLVGDNGAGKTSVLDGIAVALGGLFVNVQGVNTKNIIKDDVHLVVKALGDASTTISYCEPVAVSCSLNVGEKNYKWMRIRKELSSAHTKTDDKSASVWMKSITNQVETNLPLLSYQSAARVWKVKRGDFGSEAKRKLDDRRCGYVGCLDQSMDVKAIQQWYMKQEHSAFVKGKKIREYENFKNIVSSFMKEINELENYPVIYYSRQFEELVYVDNNQEIAISKLSAGYQSLLWMVMDLAYRTCILNPELNDKSEIKGVVLIDEIDMHLHPKWQWNIIKALGVTFPNVQFIITTHSPIVISSAKEANVILLDEEYEVTYLPDSYGYKVDDVLTFRQESVSRPKNIQMIMNAIDAAVEEEDFTDAEVALAKLKDVLGENNTEYKNMLGIICDAKMINDL